MCVQKFLGDFDRILFDVLGLNAKIAIAKILLGNESEGQRVQSTVYASMKNKCFKLHWQFYMEINLAKLLYK